MHRNEALNLLLVFSELIYNIALKSEVLKELYDCRQCKDITQFQWADCCYEREFNKQLQNTGTG